MARVAEKEEFIRLEDFIRLSKQGEQVQIAIDLSKLTIEQKVHPEETEGATGEIASYLLVGDYKCSVGERLSKIRKVYLMGSMEESLDAVKMNRNIANERLKIDYRRLKDAGIKIEERFF